MKSEISYEEISEIRQNTAHPEAYMSNGNFIDTFSIFLRNCLKDSQLSL